MSADAGEKRESAEHQEPDHTDCRSVFDVRLVSDEVVLSWPCGHIATLTNASIRVLPEMAWRVHNWTLENPDKVGVLY